MPHTRSTSSPTHVFEVIGRLDHDNTLRLSTQIEQAQRNGSIHFVLDMSGVSYINSAGLRALVQTFKRVQAAGGNMTIANPSASVQRVFNLVGLDSVFDIVFDPPGSTPGANRATGGTRQVIAFT